MEIVKKHEQQEGGPQPREISEAKLRILQPQRVKLLEKVHPHPSSKMHSQANRRVQDAQNPCPYPHAAESQN